jgi:hypothetical protein
MARAVIGGDNDEFVLVNADLDRWTDVRANVERSRALPREYLPAESPLWRPEKRLGPPSDFYSVNADRHDH